MPLGVVVLGAGFGGDGIGDLLDKVYVEGGGQGDGDGEDGGAAGVAEAVETFAAPAEGGKAEALDGRPVAAQELEFLLDGEM